MNESATTVGTGAVGETTRPREAAWLPAVGKWLLQGVGFFVVLTLISFLIVQLAPGDAVLSMLRIDTVAVTRDEIEALRTELGLNDPMWQQYLRFLGGVFHGDFGNSLMTGKPVMAALSTSFPYTLLLAGATMLAVVVLTFALGGLAALHEGRLVDRVVGVFCLAGAAVPTFWLGLLLIDLFAVRLGLLPSSGLNKPAGLILPTVALAVAIAPPYIKILRNSLIEASQREFVRAARARGVEEPVIFAKHTLRDSLIPLVTILGVSLGSLLGGTIIVEITFGIPGVGKLAVEALARRDYGVIQAFIILVGMCVFVINMLVDLSYRILDPAISLKGAEHR
ncbi:MAG TPA: ABC transporter permease [Arachnia sp.]|nr:ABC transporter permease [Arachnia sp.]HMT86944.1 ABC transporter permease [Arachnia sp.]